MEEAQAIAAEYIQSMCLTVWLVIVVNWCCISGLDNLPAEVHHLLAEIRDKENKIAGT